MHNIPSDKWLQFSSVTKRQQLSSFFIHTCRCIVDGIFQIAVYGTAHQSFHFSLCGSGCFSISLQCMNQIRFETASHIELIHRQRVIDKRLSLRKNHQSYARRKPSADVLYGSASCDTTNGQYGQVRLYSLHESCLSVPGPCSQNLAMRHSR